MSRGYSVRFIELNKSADRQHLGVKLGRMCIKYDVPVSLVADHLGVSRQAVYNWFTGVSNPKPLFAQKIKKYLERF